MDSYDNIDKGALDDLSINNIDINELLSDIDDEDPEYTVSLIGDDEEKSEEIEKKSEELCKNILLGYSIETNNKNNRIMETTKFTSSELNAITERFNTIHAFEEGKSLKDRLIAYYLSTDENLDKEEAQNVVSRLMSGVEDLTTKYNAAVDEKWNANEEISSMTANMSLEERFNFLANAVSLMRTINANVLGEVSDVDESLTEALEAIKSENTEITEDVCNTLQQTLVELIESSSLMLTGEEKIREMMQAANGESTEVVDFASAQYDDYRYKSEMALAAWVEFKNGSITSLPEDMLPESLGVSVAAGVEEAKVMEEVASGSKTVEWAVKCLKILGAVAMVCFLGYVAILGLALTVCAFFEAAILVMGTSTAAIIIASALAFLVSWGYTEVAINFCKKTIGWCGRAYDWIVEKMKDSVCPAVKNAAQKFVNWVRSLFNRSDNTQEALA